MARYLVGADPDVISSLRVYLQQRPGQFTVIPDTGISSKSNSNRMLVETTPDGAQHIQTLLAGVGVVEPDLPLNPTI